MKARVKTLAFFVLQMICYKPKNYSVNFQYPTLDFGLLERKPCILIEYGISDVGLGFFLRGRADCAIC